MTQLHHPPSLHRLNRKTINCVEIDKELRLKFREKINSLNRDYSHREIARQADMTFSVFYRLYIGETRRCNPEQAAKLKAWVLG